MSEKQSAEIPLQFFDKNAPCQICGCERKYHHPSCHSNGLQGTRCHCIKFVGGVQDTKVATENYIAALDAIRRELAHALERRRENHDHCVVRPEGDRRCKNCLYDDALLARAREFD